MDIVDTPASEGTEKVTPIKPNGASTESKTSGSEPVLYVGIGASAGGLEALNEFFDAIPADTGCAFIVVQHLSPDFKSLMDELLAKHTSMSVENVVDGVQVRGNSIYLIPARKNLMLAEGKLYLADQMKNQGVNLPIDVFFRTLAESAGDKAVGVILSGTGSDGSRGIKSIKESGGLILVQDPEAAKFDGMPLSAIQTGLVDFTLSTSGIAENLSKYAKHPTIAGTHEPLKSRLEHESEVLQRIFELLRHEGHIDFSLYKSTTVARRIEQRIGINQLHTLREYLELLEESSKEVQALGRELLINVTSFFRDPEAYEFIEERVVARIVQKAADGDELRVWVAGCSTGEEPYSMAMIFDEAIRNTDKSVKVKIFATDVDAGALAEASAAQYARNVAGEVTPERLERYFTLTPEGYEVSKNLRQTVVFANHNMISDPPFSNIDFISCRNALIYFQHAAQKKVISSFHFSLKPDAPIFFGSSESIGELKSHFEPVHDRFRVYRKVSNVKLPMGNLVRPPVGGSPQRLGIPPISSLLRTYRATQTRESSFDHVKDSLINHAVGSCIILSAEYQAVHVYGDSAKYMNEVMTGRVSTRIQDIIIPELSVALETALSRSKSEKTVVYYTNIPVEIAGEQSAVNMQTEYFEPVKEIGAYFSVMIVDAEKSVANRRNIETFDIGEQTSQRIRDLENDVLQKQEHLQVTNEELETANEELQSANEELMSSNEELQSTNEELQSVNEELFTVNSEFQEKISELTIANDDFDNILSTTSIGIVFLDEDGRIRRITDVARRFFNVLSSDIGRPLDHISHDLKYPGLFEDIRQVVLSQRPRHKEVFSLAGEFVQVKLMPYKSSAEPDGKGCIVSVADLSQRVLSEQEQGKRALRRKLASESRGIPGTMSTGLNILVIDDDKSDREAIRRYLKKIDSVSISVYEADGVEEGLKQMDDYDIDVCLLDFRLHPSDDNDFTLRAKQREYSVPIIVTSGFSRKELEGQLPAQDVVMFIPKGEMSPLVLELSIKHALGSSAALLPQ